jgi:serine/threonine protein kinase
VSALNHPNIISIYDAGEEQGTPYLVFELLKRRLLSHAAGGAPEDPQLLDVAVHIADGLAAAHTRNTTHRDPKSENFMILRRPGELIGWKW